MKTGNLEAINPDTGAKLGGVTFQDNHVEAMAFVDGDPRIFINLAQTNKIAVVDRKTMKVIATWPVLLRSRMRWWRSIPDSIASTWSAATPAWWW